MSKTIYCIPCKNGNRKIISGDIILGIAPIDADYNDRKVYRQHARSNIPLERIARNTRLLLYYRVLAVMNITSLGIMSRLLKDAYEKSSSLNPLYPYICTRYEEILYLRYQKE